MIVMDLQSISEYIYQNVRSKVYLASTLLQVDPHCSYTMGISVSLTAAASRFCLSYSSQVIVFCDSLLFF